MSVKSEPAPVQSAAPKGLSLRANFSWTFAGNIANTLSQFGMLLALARLGSPEMTGQYGLALAITAPIFLFAGMSLRNVQVTDVRDEYSFGDYASVRVIGMALALLVVVIIVGLLGYSATAAAVIVLVGLSKAIEGLSDVIFGVFHKQEHMDMIARSMIVKAVLSVIVFATILWSTGNLVLSVLSISVVWFLRLLVYDVPNLIRMRGNKGSIFGFLGESTRAMSRIPSRRTVLLSLVALSLPVGISASLISLNTNIPRYVLEWTEGAGQLGIFTVLAYPVVAGNIVVSALSQSSLPRLARLAAKEAHADFARLLIRLQLIAVALALAALIAAVLLGRITITVLFGPEYAAENKVFIVLILGMGVGFINWFMNASLQAMRKFTTMLRIQLAMLPIQIALSILLVPALGLSGAAWVIVCSLVAQVAIKALVIRRVLVA